MNQNKARDKWSFRTHLAGAVLSVAATVQLALAHQERLLPFLIFGLSMIGLYSCSALYHYVSGPPERILKLRKLDHSMIFVLIAGTYTPILTFLFDGGERILYLSVMWGVAALGALLKMFFMKAPRWLYTLLYVFMGWAALWEMPYLFQAAPALTGWLLAGGLAYTVGAGFYAFKKPNFTPAFGFHELFHVFILAGTACHYGAIAFYLA